MSLFWRKHLQKRRIDVNVSQWTEADSARAQKIWLDYQQQHDLKDKIGQTAGIDPSSGSIWFGDSIQSVIVHRREKGDGESPLFFVRVGSDAYYRKGGHR
jgi:hypothetical protein